MQRRFIFACLLLTAGLTAASTAPRESGPATKGDFNVPVAMRDGVRLSANIFRPNTPGRYPTILLRTPYNKGTAITVAWQAFVNEGYAVMVQDVRGRYRSEGKFEPINQEVNDGDDTLNWIAGQSWSDGAVGMYGGSYLGIVQWKAALTQNPHLKAIFPYVSGDDDYRDRFYSPGGAMKLGHRLLWFTENMRAPGFTPPAFRTYVTTLPVRGADLIATGHDLPDWDLAADHPVYDDFWKQASVREHLKRLHLPVYSVGGWFDNYVESDLDAFSILSKHNPSTRIMVGPWAHVFSASFAGVNFGADAQVPLRREESIWFARWLKGRNVPEARHRVRIFVMGVNRWRDEDEWPLARARRAKFYLAGGGNLLREPAIPSLPEKLRTDTYVYDPFQPTPTVGGAVCCNPQVFPWGPMDQRQVEKRRDVLVYSTPPLRSDIEVTGPIKVVLTVSSTAPDTDFTAKLVDVYPDGRALNLTDGILRARYRESIETPKLMIPGTVYRLSIDAGVTSNVFRARHRIRLEISSSNFPRFDRNSNTGTGVENETEMHKATQTVYHDHDRGSYILLPIVPNISAQLTSTSPARYVPKRTAVAR